jgi:ABC-2 type transport system permease protein
VLRYLALLKEEMRRELIISRRYWVNWASGVFTTYLIFMMIILTGSAMSGQVVANELKASALVGMAMWSLSLGCVGVLGWSFFNEAAVGTLEHLYLSPLGVRQIFLARSLVNFFMSVFIMVMVAALVMLTTGVRLHLPPLEMLIILPLSAMGMYGFGFLLAALTLTAKRTQQMMQLIQFFFLFFTGSMIPLEQMHWSVRYIGETLPLTAGIRAMREATIMGATLGDLNDHVIQMAVTSVLWLVIGLSVYALADRRARLKGNIGQY